MNFYIVIPCHNEAQFIKQTLDSLVAQTLLPKKVVIVNDQSTDDSEEIISAFAKAYSFIEILNTTSSDIHLPGSKVIQAVQKGINTLDEDYDILCKFDADLIFPVNYLETIAHEFEKNPRIGMAGGFCYVEKNGDWVLENLTNKDHIRGALKAYRKECFKEIGGLKPAMGWDTIDELLAKYYNWQVITNDTLHVKHLKPTGNTYNKAAQFKQGEAFYGMRYGFWLTLIASIKLANRKGNLLLTNDYLRGYFRAKRSKKDHLVSAQEGTFIRNLRWKGIRSKLGV
ncbi:glycosyl transferase family 2 [Dokdonia sp. Dokd-P16]|uniref:glycosyltransferase family 2 protein n=1 Tax=Dokdonia sp. Dokd-P16 TaxID=2173169 RepID=UPI000D54588E|nr:glycosyltransferase family A protein [Dokdonia sp. Dokd-P16]AWH74336.1 glycosyl transferase family 2 [Dokdonia sp. Dokd-P16]